MGSLFSWFGIKTHKTGIKKSKSNKKTKKTTTKKNVKKQIKKQKGG